MNKRDFIYVALILLLLVCLKNGCTEIDRFESLYNAASDTLHQTRNELGQQMTTTQTLHGSIDDFKKLHAADSSALAHIQKMVDNLTLSATYLATATGNVVNTTPQVIEDRDTVWHDSVAYVYPEYKTTWENKWERFNIRSNKDSTIVDYKVFNEFELAQKWRRNGLFKRKTLESSILNLNPHTETKEYKTFTVKEDKGNRLRDIGIGILAGAAAVTALNVFNVKIPITIK